ncbi:hypothetical protein [Deinococcus sp. QL22]|uniref:hypothetical protein n=1 Tax=Deinococcus sp. QL22 TaxID=2939437 RepID=UPI002017BD66|nr:hypothetical protein [Deinococcus sp. QL22]UQN07377.1 hypothetical protein M1R55_05625 [Deinococcus sp. QL22]
MNFSHSTDDLTNLLQDTVIIFTPITAKTMQAGMRDYGVMQAGMRDYGVMQAGMRDYGVMQAGMRDYGVMTTGKAA